MTKKRARLYLLLLFMAGLAAAASLAFVALGQKVSYFRTPTDIISGTYPERESGRGFRLGGLVESGSLKHEGSAIVFSVTDMQSSILVHYAGIIPDLFREGQGVVAEGKMGVGGVFIAEQLLAKHDEKYMPPEVARTLKKPTPAVMESKP